MSQICFNYSSFHDSLPLFSVYSILNDGIELCNGMHIGDPKLSREGEGAEGLKCES